MTAASGSVSNIATIAAPAGMTDAVTANNSATDTDAIVAAPIVADLVVTKTDNMTELVPGTGTVYTIVVTNHGPDAVTGATVTDTAPAGLTFGNWTCVASAGSSCASGGTGNVSTTVSLLAGGTATFTVPATLAAGAPASVANTAVVTAPGGSDRSGAGEQHGDRLEPDGAAAEREPSQYAPVRRRSSVRPRSKCPLRLTSGTPAGIR